MEVAAGAGKLVVHPQTALARRHQVGTPEIREMAGDGRLRQAKHLDDVADAHLPLLEQVKNPEPSAVRERSEHQVDAIRTARKRRDGAGGVLHRGNRPAIHRFATLFALTDEVLYSLSHMYCSAVNTAVLQ